MTQQDDKRYILKDGIHTLAWGHYRITDQAVYREKLKLVLPTFYFSRQTLGREVELFLQLSDQKPSTFRLFCQKNSS